MVVTRGYLRKFCRVSGEYPAIFHEKGELVRPLLRGGGVGPNNVPEKKTRKRQAG